MTTTALEVHGLSFSYPDGKEALRDVTLSVKDGECLGVVGPNGSGKSTLLLHFNGILPEEPPEVASVTVYGVPLGRHSLAAVRRSVGLLFQDPDDQLFCPTVYEDVAFGPRQLDMGQAERDALVRESLSRVGLTGMERRSAHHLSGGEKRRVCLAGVLACSPRILALDEPTSDLDPRGRRQLADLLERLPATKIIASHDLEFIVRLCSRVVVMDAGSIVAEGSTADVLSNEPLMLEHGLEKPHILKHLHPH